jgi:hypothetical protein
MKESAEVPDSTLFGFSWFVFEVLVKALALKLDQSLSLNGITCSSLFHLPALGICPARGTALL